MLGAAFSAVTRSRSISSSAFCTSHLYIITMRRALRSAARNAAWQPLTWNSGTASICVGG